MSLPKARSAGRHCARRGGWGFPPPAVSTPASTATCVITARRSCSRWHCAGCATSTTSPTPPWCRRRSEEHTSELQSLMRISYAVFCLKKKNKHTKPKTNNHNEYYKKHKQYKH